ncbi:MAG: prepilin-type N-terminal cleavage/methylation domain-containing protein [Acidimicrobiales bacterium]
MARHRDNGFTLVELVVALLLFSIVSLAFAYAMTGSARASNDGRLHQVAVTLADSELDAVRAIVPQGASPAGSDILAGRSKGDITGSTPSGVSLTDMVQYDVANGTPTVPLSSSTTVDTASFTTYTYLGICYLQSTAGANSCASSPTTTAPMVRAVVAVTWPGTACAAGICSYATSMVISTSPDAQFSVVTVGPTTTTSTTTSTTTVEPTTTTSSTTTSTTTTTTTTTVPPTTTTTSTSSTTTQHCRKRDRCDS